MPSSIADSFSIFLSSTFDSNCFTVPVTLFGSLSTFCGFTATFILPCLTETKKSLNSPLGKDSIISSQSGSLFVQSPKFGFNLPDNAFIAVDFPIPLGPKIPTTLSLEGVGKRNKRKPFNE